MRRFQTANLLKHSAYMETDPVTGEQRNRHLRGKFLQAVLFREPQQVRTF